MLIKGVNVNDVLVSDGQSRLKDGSRIEVVKAQGVDTLAAASSAKGEAK
jgi:hypothetical protein